MRVLENGIWGESAATVCQRQPIKSEQLWNGTVIAHTHTIIIANKADSNYSLKAFRLYFSCMSLCMPSQMESSKIGGECQHDRGWHRDSTNEQKQSASEHGNCLLLHSCIKSIFNPRLYCWAHVWRIHALLLYKDSHIECKPAVIHCESNKWFGLSFEYVVFALLLYCSQRNSILHCAKLREAIAIFILNVTTLLYVCSHV